MLRYVEKEIKFYNEYVFVVEIYLKNDKKFKKKIIMMRKIKYVCIYFRIMS